MKKYLLIVLLFLTDGLSAQFILEHNYTTDNAFRTKFGFSGEKYCLLNRSTREVEIYNPDHTLWKSIDLPVPLNFFEFNLDFISDDQLNDDAFIEVGFSYSTSSGSVYRKSQIINENGEILLTVDNGRRLEFSHIEGLPDRILVSTYNSLFHVYSVPSLTLQNTYGNYMKRIKLESSGEKYYYYDSASTEVRIYNGNTLWWVVPFSLPEGTSASVSLISEILDPNSFGLEVCYSTRVLADDTCEGRVANRHGQTLFTVPNGYFFMWSQIDGLETKLNVITRGFTTGEYERNTILSLNPLQIEHAYEENIWRTKIENSGEKYFSLNSENGLLNIYNSDHSFWRSVVLTAPSGFNAEFYFNHLSETKFNEDDGLEIAFSTRGDMGNQAKIVKESGEELLSVPNCISLRVSEIEGSETKILGTMSTGIDYSTWTAVFGINAPMSVKEFAKDSVILAPNPVDSEFSIYSETNFEQLDIYDAVGKQVSKHDINNLKVIPVQQLDNGVYTVKLMQSSGKSTVHKIVVRH